MVPLDLSIMKQDLEVHGWNPFKQIASSCQFLSILMTHGKEMKALNYSGLILLQNSLATWIS